MKVNDEKEELVSVHQSKKRTEHLSLFFEKNKKNICRDEGEILQRKFGDIIENNKFICLNEIKNYYDSIKKLKYVNYIESENLEPTYKLVVGLGEESVHETSMTIHHTYGCPYISSSAIKGVYSSYLKEIIKERFELSGKDSNILYNILFGNDEMKGILIFFDAFPTEGYKIINDNITPHYSKYYNNNGKIPPTDGEDKIIISFPAVVDTKFKFYIGYNKYYLSNYMKKNDLKEVINKIGGIEENKKKLREFLKEALYDIGIGGKTSSGYGSMK